MLEVSGYVPESFGSFQEEYDSNWLEKVPIEMVMSILYHLAATDLLIVRSCCKKLNYLCCDQRVECKANIY